MTRTPRTAGVIAAAIVAAAMFANGSAEAQTKAEAFFAKMATLPDKDRQVAIEAEAKKEGELSVYTSNINMDDWKAEFEKKYPFVKITIYRAQQALVRERALREAKAGKTGNDIADATPAELIALSQEKVVTAYKSPVLDTLRPEAKTSPDWTASRFGIYTVGWNTDQVKAGSEPKSFNDLLDPKWKGKIGFADADFVWYGTLVTYFIQQQKMSETDAKGYFKKLVANSRVVKGHTAATELLGAGQITLAPSLYAHNIDDGHFNKGMPVGREPSISPMIFEPSGHAIMKDAPHPAAALLFTDWVLTEGQKMLLPLYRLPASTKVAGVEKLQPKNVTTITIPDAIYDKADTWSKEYDDIQRAAAANK